MCGLVGVAGNLDTKDEPFMKRLLVLDVFRGFDSTGIAVVDAKKDRHFNVVKMASHPLDLFDKPDFKTALNGNASVAFIGHNRAATVGKVNAVSAHPYEHKDVVGAHNGTLHGYNWTNLEEYIEQKTTTDSEAIICSIAEFGIEETIPLLHKGVTSQFGAWALTWYDREDDTINLLRNDHRPLWFCFNDDLNKVAWASEWPMLHAAAKLSGWELYKDEEGNSFWSTETDCLYSIPIGDLLSGLKKGSLEAYKTRGIKGKEPAVSTTVGAPFQPRGTTSTTNGTTSRTNPVDGTKTYGTGSDSGNVHYLRGTDNEPIAGLITEQRFNELSQHGCSFCRKELTIEDEGLYIYDHDDVILCKDCAPRERNDVTVFTSAARIAVAAAFV